MKAKKLIPTFALLLSLTALTACAGDKTVEFGNYWTGDALISGTEIHETLKYDASFAPTEVTETLDYTFAYTNGSLVTTLDSTTENGKVVYVFKTEMNIDVTYTFKGESSEPFKDSIVSEVRFYEAANNLKPISSNKTIVIHNPTNGNKHTKLSKCYRISNYTIQTTYDEKGKGNCVVTSTDNADFSFKDKFSPDKDYNFIDNEQLLVALRAISKDTSSATVESYSPFVGNPQKIKFSFADGKSGQKFDLIENGQDFTGEKSRAIAYRKVTMSIDAANSGSSQIAGVATGNTSTYRNVVLRNETPHAYGLGSLVFQLKEITRS